MSLHRPRIHALAAAAIAAAGATASAVPVSTWNLNEPTGTTGVNSVLDSVSGFNGTPVGTVAFGAQGANPNTGTSASFSGAGNIDVNFTPSLNPANFTVSSWVKVANGSNAGGQFRSVITSRNDSGTGIPAAGNEGFILYAANNNTWQFWTGNGTPGGWNNLAGPAVQEGVWTHLAMTFNGTTKNLYVNGALAATANQTYIPNAAEKLHIGGGADDGLSFRFNGLIDDVRVLNNAATASDVAALMQGGPSKNVSAGKQYAYTVLPQFSGGTYYFDDTHVQATNTFSTGELTDGVTFPSAGTPTSPTVNAIVGWGDPASIGSAITFDLGEGFNIDLVRLGTHTYAPFANGAPDGVAIEFSSDNVTYGGLVNASFVAPPSNGHWDLDVAVPDVVARYVRLTFNGGAVLTGNTPNKWMLDEITIFGSAIPEPATLSLLALGGLTLLRRRRAV